ncbi:AraC family transcriptional regulator [Leptolyngbya sp. FACHB-541]|uniref:AraC family transcriptional regulator n=1 Tax=Leptolyngbya sp. FACHB-541 TaxID=2692810 RepID=UPI001F5500B7|nr:AraC family transcriptional regulator [Leptolyngbya sp. FACHB-541]
MLTITTPTLKAKRKGLTHTRLQQVLGYIRTHLDRDLSLTELAEVISISPTCFASLFKQIMGISPRQYVIQQRVEQAKLMLSKTDLAITRRGTCFANRRHCPTSRLLYPKPFDATV